MLQEANNFYLGTGIVSRLYRGETLVWPFSVTYSNENIVTDLDNGNPPSSGIYVF
jgi:hypothetical protein